MNKLDFLVRDLPSPEAARRFFEQFSERNPTHCGRLQKDDGLFSDVLALASYSPLLATTLIQNPDYVNWLARKRGDPAVRGKEELLESLARFSLTNSQLEPHVLFARFRRRELLRIFLRDIRRLGTIAEITEEISNLADAILENALRLARQQMDNRYGAPFEKDENGRERPSDLCIVSLGKLGSKELNYSSDIDLLFIYSGDGVTSGTGSRGTVTNREYFVKLAETATQLVGQQTGEGAAYRVDMRLRPHGRVGALALSLRETASYYLNTARSWEQQVLIRSRPSAGDAGIYKAFFAAVEETVFRPGRDEKEALNEVFRSKQNIDKHRQADTLFDVKLGRGGIREIEFIAQALQLAHGGTDKWLRAPHTLISISRLADRGLLTETERSEMSHAYDFLRRLEHILQMEQGLQTHSLPAGSEKLALIAGMMSVADPETLKADLEMHTTAVHAAFRRVFGQDERFEFSEPDASSAPNAGRPEQARSDGLQNDQDCIRATGRGQRGANSLMATVAARSPKFAQMIAALPNLIVPRTIPDPATELSDPEALFSRLPTAVDHAHLLEQMRVLWADRLFKIAVADIHRAVTTEESRRFQTTLAEASVAFAIRSAVSSIVKRKDLSLREPAVLALGKLGSGTLDYDSDLDLIVVYDEASASSEFNAEAYSRVVEEFVTLLSSMTRHGNLYRVDLRLRPYGKNGPNVTTRAAFVEYVEEKASPWELLAYVQIRGLCGEGTVAAEVEAEVRNAIERRVAREDLSKLKKEARDMRLRLEGTHGRTQRGSDINIKFSSGGLLDVYFVVRYLQLEFPEAVGPGDRSTSAKLNAFRERHILHPDIFDVLASGHNFLSELDHSIRLTIGRTTRFPRANSSAMARIAERMEAASPADLDQQLSFHRINIRAAFDEILGN